MDTPLIISRPRTVGRAARPVSADYVRDLDPADLALLQEEVGTKASPLRRITQRHHALARAIANGTPEGEAALLCGLSLNRVSILKADPSFRELVSFYSGEVNEAFRGMQEKLAGIAETALDELQDRLEDEPEKISVPNLLELVRLGADRTGHGPQSSSTQVNVNVDLADRLAAARARVAARNKTIDV